MKEGIHTIYKRKCRLLKVFLVLLTLPLAAFLHSDLEAFTVDLSVVGSDGGVVGGFRWLVEEDTTHPVTPGVSDPNSLSLSFHRSYAPVVVKGDSTDTAINLPDGKGYFVSVLPDSGYTIGGAPVADGQGTVTVTVNKLPLPTAQITVFVFEDNHPINNAPEPPVERGLEGFTVVIADAAGRYGIPGGQQMMDAFANMIGTTYQKNPDGSFKLDGEGNPIVDLMGDGFVLTDADGLATIKYLSPGKYGVQVVPPAGEGWQQTSTIEGTKTIDAWVKPDEPPFFVEFGPAGFHVFVGFIRPTDDIPPIPVGENAGTITGQIVNLHTSRPPAIGFNPGEPLSNCWVGLNEGVAGTGRGIYAQPCDPDTGEFSIPNIPPGSYQLVFWDRYLDNIFAFLGVTVPPEGGTIALGEIPVFRWFGRLESRVFYDANENGFRDPDETYVLPEQAVNLRFRDGTVYQSFPTDMGGEVPFDEVFPFFHWLVGEVDFLRFKATGATIIVDGGGPVAQGEKLTPQEQDEINPNTGDNLSRTETGPVLTQAMQLFLGSTNVIEWGKKEYGPGENGGISGIVYYATTRAEHDPRFAVGEEWEPGIPRVQGNLYADGDIDNEPWGAGNFPGPEDIDWNENGVFDPPDGIIDDVDGDGLVTLADVDNYPFGWADGTAPKGAEDIDQDDPNGDVVDAVFNPGDAIQITTSDSWDDNLPADCPGDPTDPFYNEGKCYDGLRNYNQVRPGVFDGGYAFDTYFPGGVASGGAEVEGLPAGTYIVEAVPPPGYELVKEEDKNVDFGDEYVPSPLLLPPICVGDPHTVPAELSLFPGVQAPFAGEERPLCNEKQVVLTEGFNAAADFFMFTEVPKAGRIVGFVLDDFANEFDPNSPSFGEKFAPPWLPVSIRDYTGQEISRVYTDEFGAYNALVPSTYTMNLNIPSGVSPNMLTVCINDATDPFHNPQYSQFCYTFQYMPGVTTYLDTPVIPIAAFAGPDQFPLDCELPDGTPVISRVDGPAGGPYSSAPGQTITIQSVGTAVEVSNPDFGAPGEPRTITRDYGFGGVQGSGTVTIGGIEQIVTAWSATSIEVTAANGGQLMVTRNNGNSTVVGVTVTVGGPAPSRVPTDFPTIQAAIDAAATVDGDLILVEPGVYEELVILYKDVKLQGYGAGSTTINAVSVPAEKLQNWRNKIDTLLAAGAFDLLPGQLVTDEILPTGLFATETGPGVIVLGSVDGGGQVDFGNARIDGFKITGADQGGGIFVNGYTEDLVISNNRISSNQGFYGGGIRIGHPALITIDPQTAEDHYVDAMNDNVKIQYNQITQNGGLNGAGGISIFTGADNYEVTENFICGNLSGADGGGFGHVGLSNNGGVTNNTIIFNQSFNQGRTVSGGGMFIAGLPAVGDTDLSPGTGSVSVVSNLIQGNLAGAGDGGGISLRLVNGLDVAASPTDPANWYEIQVNNNIVVNNVTGLAGGGISMQDATNVTIDSNTFANNDSTATASEAFTAGPTVSTAQPAGVVSRAHSADLLAALGIAAGFSDPVVFDNNIIWQNRSFNWDVAANEGRGGLLPDIGAGQPPVFNDLAVLGATGRMNPLDGILTDTTGYDDSNTDADPGFVDAYFNRSAGLVVPPDRNTGIETAVAFDEGGNFIDVRFGPLTLTGNYLSGSGSGVVPPVGVLSSDDLPTAGGGIAAGVGSSGGSGGGCFITAAALRWPSALGTSMLLLVLGGIGVKTLINRKSRSHGLD